MQNVPKFKGRELNVESLRAHLLVAVPQLPDTNFYRTVVLMIQHDEEGAFGVVLNRPSEVTIADIWEKVTSHPCDRADPINLGGPVQGPLLAVHTDVACAENEIMSGVYLASDRDYLEKLVQQRTHVFRIFSGYSGWGGGQLEGELEAGGWLTTPATRNYIFGNDEDLWKTVAQNIGREILFDKLNIRRAPRDPSMN